MKPRKARKYVFTCGVCGKRLTRICKRRPAVCLPCREKVNQASIDRNNAAAKARRAEARRGIEIDPCVCDSFSLKELFDKNFAWRV